MRRSADPYRDVHVIDARAPRTNQAVIGLVSVLAVATGWWWLLTLLALQLAVGLVFGRRYCLPCLLYFELIQPRFGEGPLEDSRPPRAANVVGLVFLTAASIAYAAGSDTAGRRLRPPPAPPAPPAPPPPLFPPRAAGQARRLPPR